MSIGTVAKVAGVIALVGMGGTATAGAQMEMAPSWGIDVPHSAIGFKVRHFFTPVRGEFQSYDIQLRYDPERPERSSVWVEIDVSSVNTDNQRRDNHLRTPDWFEAERWPLITFQSTSVRQVSDNQLVAVGDLTIKDVTRSVELPITVLGVMDLPPEMQDRMGTSQIGSFAAILTIDRRDFGVGTGSWAETAIVGADVEIEILVEAKRQ
jgi:polyisoprenoid-binding protein YceI